MARNIILLSDGTGNSSKANNPTNVWRLYKALDLQTDDQIAVYDDGVGTSGIRFLKLLGGVFGWGLKANVTELYRALCEHYRLGDRVYIFGFSRGAYTARVLAHLIVTCGIIDTGKTIRKRGWFGRESAPVPISRRAGLGYAVKAAMRRYRHLHWQRASWIPRLLSALALPVRFALRGLTEDAARFREAYSYGTEKPVDFIGVWDTVDAVGMPVDELCVLLHHTVYPYRFLDQNLSDGVARACQALAIDDERQTFHPLLWNERPDGRVAQTWFAGMHSNVGGSYPDDDLSHIPLIWMIRHAREAGLEFVEPIVEDYAKRADAIGKMYDSRAGLAIYYRYKPRFIADLCDDKKRKIHTKPVIHESVFNRIVSKKVGYSPVAIPADYLVEDGDGARKPPEEGRFPEPEADRGRRKEYLNRARGQVTRQRFAYYCLLGLTGVLAAVPLFVDPGGKMPDQGVFGALARYLNLFFTAVDSAIPEWAARWPQAWVRAPGLFITLLGGFAVWFVYRNSIVGAVRRHADDAWAHMRR